MDLVCKRNATSLVWAYFGFKADEYGKPRDIKQVVCRLCRRIIQHKGGNTTNLRSHLKNKHPKEFSELILVTPPAMASEIQDGEIGQEDNGEDLPVAQPGLNQNYVPDQALPRGNPWLHGGPSKAVSSLPSCLRLWKGPGSASWAGAVAPHHQETMSGDLRVYAQTPLQQGWMFGPYVGELSNGQQNTLKYAWAIREGEDFLYINGYDENNSNWMRYVAYASNEDEHNMTVFQFCRQIYYRVSKPIPAGAELKVWIGKDYASMLGLVADDSLKFELNDKEWILKIFQDIQAVPVGGASAACSEQGSASSIGSDNCSSSQSQSHMADISDVAGVPKAPSINSPPSSSSPTCLSPTPAKLTAPTDLFASRPQLGERYDFIPGAEMLIKPPQAAIQRVWYFFGFEPDPTGMPLDRSTVVCKLCGEKMGFKGGPGDLQNHLTTKHHMQSRDVNREVRCLTYPQYKPCFTAMAPGQSNSPQISYCRPMSPATEASSPSSFKPGMALSLIFSAQMTDAIINFLIRDLQPVCMVEGEGFQQLIDCLNPSCGKLPSVNQLNALLTELHNKGRKALAKQLKRPCEETDDIWDQTTPIKPRGRVRPRALGPREVPYAVALSADVWSHAWQGGSERHTTVWAHWVDPDDFSPHNVALSSQLLGGSGPDETEARVRAVGVGWGILHPSLVLLGSEARGKGGAGLGEPGNGDGAGGGGAPHPNSTTFLERQDSGSSDEMSALERVRSPSATSASTTVSPPTIPCFFTAVQACIEEATSHLVISRTLDQFQKLISTLLTLQDQNRASPGHPTERQSRVLPRKELQAWVDGQPSWAQLYSQLKILLQQQTLLSEVIREVREETQTKGGQVVCDAACSVVELDDCSKVKSVCDPASPPALASSGGIVCPRRSDWKVLEELCSVLKPLDVACRTLASEKFPRLSLVKPVLTGLLTRHLVTRPHEASPLFKEVKRRMRQTLVGRYGDPEVDRVLCMACALDPQFKGLSFMELKEQAATFNSLKDEAVKTIKLDRTPSQGRPKKRGSALESLSKETNVGCPRRSKRLKEAPTLSFREAEEEEEEEEDGSDIKEEKEEEEVGSNLKQEYDEEEEEEKDSDWEASDKEETPEPALSGMEFLLGDLFSSPPPATQISMEESVDMELSVYRADKGAWLGKDPLQWWSTKAGQLPILAKVACAYLAAPAVVGGVAEAYLGEDDGAMHRKRANIPPQCLDEILFLHHNRITTGNSQE